MCLLWKRSNYVLIHRNGFKSTDGVRLCDSLFSLLIYYRQFCMFFFVGMDEYTRTQAHTYACRHIYWAKRCCFNVCDSMFFCMCMRLYRLIIWALLIFIGLFVCYRVERTRVRSTYYSIYRFFLIAFEPQKPNETKYIDIDAWTYAQNRTQLLWLHWNHAGGVCARFFLSSSSPLTTFILWIVICLLFRSFHFQ